MEVQINSKLANIIESDFLANILSIGVEKKYSFAVWRTPGSTKTHVMLGHPQRFKTEELDLSSSGFVFHPYAKKELGFIITPAFLAKFETTAFIELDKDQLFDNINFNKKNVKLPIVSNNNEEQSYCTNGDDFINYVEKGIEKIRTGELQKVVSSRSKSIDLPNEFDVIETFQKLCSTYPNAFVSLVSIDGAGTWMGATPELLIDVDEGKCFKTVALAGTQQYDGISSLSSIAWTQKEIEEQALVSRYIINCFKKIRLREFEEIGPKTVIAGNLIHLKTTFEVDMETTNFSDLGSVMVNLLHPTSAICGMPQDKAEQFIIEHEGHKRGFFGGYLGPMNIENKISIYVNLRCMQLLGKKALLYAGAGLTEDSNALKELQETELKMETLLNVINN